MVLLSNLVFEIILLCSVNFWHLQDSNSLFRPACFKRGLVMWLLNVSGLYFSLKAFSWRVIYFAAVIWAVTQCHAKSRNILELRNDQNSLQNRRYFFLRFAGEREGEHKARGEREARVTRDGLGANPIARDSRSPAKRKKIAPVLQANQNNCEFD